MGWYSLYKKGEHYVLDNSRSDLLEKLGFVRIVEWEGRKRNIKTYCYPCCWSSELFGKDRLMQLVRIDIGIEAEYVAEMVKRKKMKYIRYKERRINGKIH